MAAQAILHQRLQLQPADALPALRHIQQPMRAVPDLQHIKQPMRAGGCVPATFKTLQKALKRGNSVLVLVGGIAEMFLTEPDREVIVLKRRRGFVRAALEAGVPILPVYYFGQSQVTSFGPRCCFCAGSATACVPHDGQLQPHKGALPCVAHSPCWRLPAELADAGGGEPDSAYAATGPCRRSAGSSGSASGLRTAP